MRGGGEPDPLGADRPGGGDHALADAALDQEILDFAVLHDVDAERVGGARIAPGDARRGERAAALCQTPPNTG